MLEQIQTWLAGNPTLNLVFLVLAVCSIILSIILYFKSKKSKDPRYLTHCFPLIENSISAIDGLDIQYHGTQIERLTLSKVSFWNNGRETISRTDIASADKLRVFTEKPNKIIDAKLIWSKREANDFYIRLDDNVALIEFDFLDFGDGAVFEIYHTGEPLSTLKISGTIKGSNKLAKGKLEKEFLTNLTFDTLISWFFNIENKLLKMLLTPLLLAVTVTILTPISFLTLPIDRARSLLHRTPKEYDLSGNEKGA